MEDAYTRFILILYFEYWTKGILIRIFDESCQLESIYHFHWVCYTQINANAIRSKMTDIQNVTHQTIRTTWAISAWRKYGSYLPRRMKIIVFLRRKYLRKKNTAIYSDHIGYFYELGFNNNIKQSKTGSKCWIKYWNGDSNGMDFRYILWNSAIHLTVQYPSTSHYFIIMICASPERPAIFSKISVLDILWAEFQITFRQHRSDRNRQFLPTPTALTSVFWHFLSMKSRSIKRSERWLEIVYILEMFIETCTLKSVSEKLLNRKCVRSGNTADGFAYTGII